MTNDNPKCEHDCGKFWERRLTLFGQPNRGWERTNKLHSPICCYCPKPLPSEPSCGVCSNGAILVVGFRCDNCGRENKPQPQADQSVGDIDKFVDEMFKTNFAVNDIRDTPMNTWGLNSAVKSALKAERSSMASLQSRLEEYKGSNQRQGVRIIALEEKLRAAEDKFKHYFTDIDADRVKQIMALEAKVKELEEWKHGKKGIEDYYTVKEALAAAISERDEARSQFLVIKQNDEKRIYTAESQLSALNKRAESLVAGLQPVLDCETSCVEYSALPNCRGVVEQALKAFREGAE